MPQIGNSNLQTVLDKMARFAAESVGDPEFSDGFNAGMEKASEDVWGPLATFLLGLSDEDVESDLLPPARVLDETHPSPADGFMLGITSVTNMCKALDTHFKNFGFAGLDAYLKTQNGTTGMTPTLRAHGMYARYLKTLSAVNSFIPNDLVIATFTETGATAGTFVKVQATGIDKTKYAGAKFVIKNVGALTTSAVVSVTAKKLDGTVATLTATLATHTDAHETDLSDTALVYQDVTGISITTGTASDEFEVVAKSDRSIASA